MAETLSLKKAALSKGLFDEARRYIPGGVNSPVRSFKAVGGYPVFVNHAKGSKIYGECGRQFIDYCLSWGSLILGHAHTEVVGELRRIIEKGLSFGTPTRIETELAKLIVEAIPSIERVRLTNSGTEAVMSAVRLARAYTHKDKIIKFEGSYHGHADYLLDCAGVPEDFKNKTLKVPYNNADALEEVVRKYKDEIAAIIVEPVAANMGIVLPRDEFLKALKALTKVYKIILIFDEVITGFRLCYGGAQKLFGVKPDLTCLGKIIGGGLPIGAFGGRLDIMKLLSPEGGVYQAGTFSGNSLSVAAGIAVLNILKKEEPYKKLNDKTSHLCSEILAMAGRYNIGLKINSMGSMFSLFFRDEDVSDYLTAKDVDLRLFKRFYHCILDEGIYLSPSSLESNFLSIAHSAGDIDDTIEAVGVTFNKLSKRG